MLNKILFLIVVFLSNVIQCITGFAGTVLAMPFSVMLVGFETARPVLNVLGLLASVYVLSVSFKSLNKKEFLKISAVMVLGILGGIFIKDALSAYSSALYKILGILVIFFALLNAYSFYSKKSGSKMPVPLQYAVLILSGLVHGVFVCGGPLLVTYASSKMKDKDEFRSTLSAVWIFLNGIIAVSDIFGGAFTVSVIKISCLSVIVLIFALILGNLVYKKMSRKAFLNLTYVLMVISGISLLVK